MKQQIKHRLKLYPVALTGLALGIIGLSSSWAILMHQRFLYIGAVIAFFFLLVITFKNFFHPKVLLEEIQHPVIGTFIPTFDMALMLIAYTIEPLVPFLGKFLWLLAIVLHFTILILFLYYRLMNFQIRQLIPSWFIPTVGMVVASVSGSNMDFPMISQGIFYIGFIFYLILLPVMLYRLLFITSIEEPVLPSFGIMAAAPNLCLAGYLTAFPNPDIIIVSILVSLAVFNTLLVYISMVRIFQIKFLPIFAAYTFPLSIGVTAMMKFSNYLFMLNNIFFQLFQQIMYIQLIVATIIISYVFVRMIFWLHKHVHNLDLY